MSIGKEELEAVTRVINSRCLSAYQGNWSDAFYGGPEIKALEKEWAEYFGVKHAIACNSATSGLWAACNAIGIKPGDEVIVSPYTMTCSASIPLLFGAKPVFVDIEPDYFCVDPDDIERKITDKTKATIAVDIFGQPCDFDRINEIAKKHGIIVIEDAAQSVGATYKGKYAGTLADIGVFSLNRHKHINCGEGGVITTDNADLAFKLKLSINHAEAVCNDMERQNCDIRDYALLAGMNLRMTELSAAVAREQLKKLDSLLNIYRKYAEYFKVKVRPDCEHAFYRYAQITPMHNILTDEYKKYAYKHHYITPIYQMTLFKQLGYDQHQCPVCEDIESKIVLAWLKDEP